MVASGLKESCNETECAEIGTNECGYNSYTPAHERETCPKGKRIDYILYRSGNNYEVSHIMTNFFHFKWIGCDEIISFFFFDFSIDRLKWLNTNFHYRIMYRITK